MKPKRLISLLVAVCMMITMLPLSAVTAFAEDTSAPTGTASYGDYEYDYTVLQPSQNFVPLLMAPTTSPYPQILADSL